jgi:hypothetical protein
VSLRASDSEVAQVSAGRSRQKESLAASPRAPGGLGSRSPSELRINELGEGRSLYMTMLSGGLGE